MFSILSTLNLRIKETNIYASFKNEIPNDMNNMWHINKSESNLVSNAPGSIYATINSPYLVDFVIQIF